MQRQVDFFVQYLLDDSDIVISEEQRIKTVFFQPECHFLVRHKIDVLGRITSEIKKPLGGVEISTITSAYDKAGNRTSVTYPNGRTLYSTYNKRNALKTIIDNGETTIYTYDANGNRTGLLLPNNVNTMTAFDAGNRVTSISEISSSGMRYQALYYYDKTAARVRITESREGAVVRDSIYTYDQTDKLLSESDGTTAIVYTYDDADNRIAKTVNGVTTTYELDKLNRVLSSTTNGITDATYTYDLNGSRMTKTVGTLTHNYVYDRENRLTSVSTGGTDIFNATYDYRTRRMTRLENNTLTQYVYDGGECAQERDSAGSLTKTFIRGSGLGGGIGSILYSEKPSQPREYFLYNVIGSVVVTCDQAGNEISTSLYEAFGKVIASTGSSDNNRLFCTKERSESIGLDNFGFRYFDWDIGRFIQRDPSGYPDGLNNYLYCKNNPVNKIDPLGLYIETAWDALNISVGVGSLIDNIKSGNYKAAIVDAAGIVVDGTAAALPGVPGGCELGIRAARTANKGKEIVEQTAKTLLKKNADEAVQAVATPVVKNADEATQAVPKPVAKNADEAVQTATTPTTKQLDKIKKDDYVNLTDDKAKKHILEGDTTGGGHRPGAGKPGKSEFPEGTSDEKILNDISDVATDPKATRNVQKDGRIISEGTRDGVNIKTVQEKDGGRIVTGYPTNTPRNPAPKNKIEK